MKTYKKVLSVVFLLFLPSVIFPQVVNHDSLAQNDAIILTLRFQKTGVFIDSLLLKNIYFVLQKARATLDTLKTIHAFPDYVHNELIVSSTAPWTDQWKNGILLTGYSPVDTLLKKYNATSVKYNSLSSYVIRFGQPLQIKNLSAEFQKDTNFNYAEPNGYVGDGNNIETVYKNGEWGIAFSRGFGDCPAGCISRYYWYVSVKDSIADFVEDVERDYRDTKIYRWHIPNQVKLNAYSSIQEIIDAAKNEKIWWLRKHAVRSLGGIFKYLPSNSEPKLFQMQNEANSRKQEIYNLLRSLVNDPDEDIYSSAIFGLGTLVGDYEGYTAYFPLKKGNELYFKGNLSLEPPEFGHWKVEKDTVIGSFDRNLVVDDRIFFNRKLILLSYVSGGRVLYLDAGKNYQTLIDFNKTEGSSWEVTFGDKKYRVLLVSKNDSVGNYKHCYSFEIISSSGGKFPLDKVWLAPGIGFVVRKSYAVGVPMLLITNQSTLSGISPLTSVESEIRSTPNTFSLYQNYPNPFNPETVISYQLSANSRITLKVFDVVGREVATVFEGVKEAGFHQEKFQAKSFASGMYIYQIVAETPDGKKEIARKTMLLIK